VVNVTGNAPATGWWPYAVPSRDGDARRTPHL